jgi:hypothetical protein
MVAPAPLPSVLKTGVSFQVAYRDRLIAIRATLEISPFFKCHEVDTVTAPQAEPVC